MTDNYELLSEALAEAIILREELEYLRSLIIAWADATDNDERDGWVSSEVIQAEAALRKAVGR